MSTPTDRVSVSGKFLRIGDETYYARGVTYGTFRADDTGLPYPRRNVVADDFALMASNGINAVRTYTMPPVWLLDEALDHGIRVMAGIPIGRYFSYLAGRNGSSDAADLVGRVVRERAGHPGVLCYAIGNEIPAGIVRFHGRRYVERYLRSLYATAKQADPGSIITYGNYPSTEYLQLDFLDVVLFNVFLESQDRLSAYLARLQNIAGNRPLIIGELGLDSLSHGERRQAESAGWQLRTAFSEACAGAFVFSWTDEWHRGGKDVLDWRFGITRADRRAKPALTTVRRVFSAVPLPPDDPKPRISVVVCSFNGADRLGECLDGISQLDYPHYETIVVDNGSTDHTAAVAETYPNVKVVRTPPTGLGDARNIGMEAATGEIVAYIDDDAIPDRNWLTYLANTFEDNDFAAVGGPNIPPPGGNFVSQCIRRAPGNPIHVLLSDREAEHIAGCNMAFKRRVLAEIGGFDPVYRVAGDDVDVCWRIRESGYKLGFSHGAMVLHHPRPTVSAFWRQQIGYGKAEALLETKWPDKYNGTGQARWAGRMYGVAMSSLLRRSRIYHGTWGTAPFQGLYQDESGRLASLASSPAWYLLLSGLAAFSSLAWLWPPLALAVPLLASAVVLLLAQAIHSGMTATMDGAWSRFERFRARALIALLHIVQPMARMWGRVRSGLTPWRHARLRGFSVPYVKHDSFWSERWRESAAWIKSIEAGLEDLGLLMQRGGMFSRFDLEVRSGAIGGARLLIAVEDHAGGHQLIRTRTWPRLHLWVYLPIGGAILATTLAMSRAWGPALMLGSASLIVTILVVWQCGRTMAAIRGGVAQALSVFGTSTLN